MLLKDQVESLKAVAFGKADATIGGINIQNYLIRQNMLNNLKVVSGLPEKIFSNRLRIGVRDDWPELAAILQKAIDSVSEQEYSGLSDQWISTIKEAEPGSITEEEQSWLAEHSKMSIGISSGWAPFEFFDANGVFSGVSSDYFRILTKWLGVAFTPQEGLTWAEVLEKARNKEIDVISAIVQTPERSEYLHFTKPYISLPMMVVTREDSPYIQGIKDLKDKTIAVVREYVTQGYLEEDHPGQKLLLLDSLEEVLTAVSEGRADALVENMAVVGFVSKKLGITNLRAAAATPYSFELSYGVRKDWPEFMPILEKALAAFSDQEKRLILDKWINVQVEKQTDWKVVWMIILIGTFVAGSILSVILIWNRRLAGEIAERKQKEKLIMAGAQISQSLTVGDNLKETLLSTTDILVKGLNMALARIWIVDETENVLKLQASSGLYTHIDGAHERMPIGGDTKIGRVVSEQKPHMSNSIQDDPYVKDKDWAREQGLTSYAGIPMVVEGRSVGALVMFSREAIQGDTRRTILSIADSIAVAVERSRAEEAVLISERKIRGMSESSLDAMIMIDGKANIIFWNPAAEKIFGYSAEEVMSRNLHDFILPPEDRELAYKGIDAFVQTGKGKILGLVIEHKALRKDGSIFPAEIAVSALQMDNEWFAVGSVRDISERKKADEALRDSQKQFRIIADYTYDWEGWHDDKGSLLWINPAVERISGYSVQECIAMGDYPLPLIHPDDRHVWKESLTVAMKGRPGNDVPFRVVRKDGIEIWVAVSWNPVFDDEGVFTGFRTSARDFTDRKLAEEALKKSEKRVKSILETADEGFFIVDNNQETIEANPTMCGILDRELDEVIGMSIFDFVNEENKKIFHEQVELRNRGITNAYEVALSRPDGSHVFCIFNSTPLYDEKNEKIGAFAMVTDITARKKGEEELQQNLKDLERFSSMAVGREEKMIELKEEINELLIQSGKGEKYKIVQ